MSKVDDIAHYTTCGESECGKKFHGDCLSEKRSLNQVLDKRGCLQHKPKSKTLFTNAAEHYCIIIKPKLTKSNSCSDLVTGHDELFSVFDLVLDYEKATECLQRAEPSGGDAGTAVMSFSRSNKAKKSKKKGDDVGMCSYASTFAHKFMQQSETPTLEASTSNYKEHQSAGDPEKGRKAAFPFKQTPSGNFKVQSNQVVFQSPTVGVLLADPANAKVKVKFEGNSSSEADLTHSEPEVLFGERERSTFVVERAELVAELAAELAARSTPVKDDNTKDLACLGYSMTEPVDWSRVQLPKKADLYQEFYRRILNYINTDVVIQIGDEEFNCHLMVLRVYSGYFDKTTEKVVKLEKTSVSPQAFHTMYEWMIFCGSDSHKTLKRSNVLDLFLAAQHLQVKDLEEQCWSFIVNEELFTEDTAFALFQKARIQGITPVMELMVPRVMRFFLPLVASSDFLKLSLDEVLVFMKSNYICVTSEMEVLMAGVRWLRGDWPARRCHVSDVMRCVRFGLVSPWQLVDVKRNRDNPELLETIQEPDVQHMVDDGLAYVIIKYWYGNNSKNYYHWIDVLGLVEPAERNWIGEEKNHASYKEFLKYLEQFLVPRDQAYQQLAMQQTPRRNEDLPGGMRGMDADKMEMRRPKIDFPLPATLKGLTDNKGFPTMSEFFDSRRKAHEAAQQRVGPMAEHAGAATSGMAAAGMAPSGMTASGMAASGMAAPGMLASGIAAPGMPASGMATSGMAAPGMPASGMAAPGVSAAGPHTRAPAPLHFADAVRHAPDALSTHQSMQKEQEDLERQIELQKQHLQRLQLQHVQLQRTSYTDTQEESDAVSVKHVAPAYQAAEKEGLEETSHGFSDTDTSSDATIPATERMPPGRETARRQSIAASYLAAATAALATSSRASGAGAGALSAGAPPQRSPTRRAEDVDAADDSDARHAANATSFRDHPSAEQQSIFNPSKEMLAKANMNKLSHSVLGPSIKNYTADGSLFSWDRESVLVFGGVDPHTAYGLGSNTGRDIHRFDPVANVWEYVGELPEPRHHHAIAFLRGRVYLAGGADPRDDDARGKSVVVSTVWSYDPTSRSWYSEAGLAVPRKNFGLVAHRMALYAIGGQDRKGRVLRSVERLDARANTWNEVRALGVARMGVACAKYREYIWVAGGMTGDRKKPLSRIVECYNSTTNEWTEINCLRFPRCFATLFAMNDKLYIVGGAARVSEKEKSTSSVGAVDVWDWKEREWRQQTEMSIPRHGHALAYLGTQLIIIGGVTTIYMRALNNVESYCCERASWIRGVGALPSPLSGHGAVTLPPASLM